MFACSFCLHHAWVNVCISPGGLLFVTQICSRRRVNNLPELWHRCGASSREELRMINNWSSPSCNFIHCLSSNWLLQVGFLTCPTINVLPFMHLINGHCSFMKNTHSITSGIEKPRQFVLYRFAGDGTETLINRNGIQQDRLSLLDQIGLFFILLSRCHCGTTLQLKFSYRSTIQLSTISAALLQLVRSEAVTFPSPLCDTVFMFSERGESYSMYSTFHIWWRLIVLCTNNTRTHRDGRHLSLELMFREATQSKSMGWCFK